MFLKSTSKKGGDNEIRHLASFENGTIDTSIDSFLKDKIEAAVGSKITNLLIDPVFLDSLKEKLGINSTPDEFIDIPTVCYLLNISRTTCHNRVKAGILIQHRSEGSRKVMFSRKQVLSTLKSMTILKHKL